MKKIRSIRVKLFVTLCLSVMMIIAFLVIINSCTLESYHYYSQKNSMLEIYNCINKSVKNNNLDFDVDIDKLVEKASFDVVVRDGEEIVYQNKKDFSNNFGEIPEVKYSVEYTVFNQGEILYSNQKIAIRRIQDKKNGYNYMLLSGKLDNGYDIFIRVPTVLIEENVKLSNNILYIIALIAIILGGIAISLITEKFSKPIEELNDIANKMSKLDFSKKYRILDNNDELDELGKSINTMSYKLEETIKKLKQNNIELEKDIEKKSKIDEMRKQFISDVSHELKTPIALIQGYAEGLIENVNTDNESRKFYADVILDESNKMDELVKRLLDLMKLEYGERTFNNDKFDISELINDVVKNSKMRLEHQEINVEITLNEPIYVYADSFYIEQVFRNYYTNALKNIKAINNKKYIKISFERRNNNKIRINVFNTGDKIDDENLNRIWNRFYKVDTSRNREQGGTGLGLSIVKAIMNQYENDYGVINKKNGVEFYFDVNLYEE